MAFIDYEKAFVSVDTAAVLKALKDQGIEENYKRLLHDIYKGCTGRIIFHKISEKLPTRKGVRQGDANSPKLFTECLENIFRKLNWECLSRLRFAGDIVSVSESAEHLQKMLQELQSESWAMG